MQLPVKLQKKIKTKKKKKKKKKSRKYVFRRTQTTNKVPAYIFR